MIMHEREKVGFVKGQLKAALGHVWFDQASGPSLKIEPTVRAAKWILLLVAGMEDSEANSNTGPAGAQSFLSACKNR